MKISKQELRSYLVRHLYFFGALVSVLIVFALVTTKLEQSRDFRFPKLEDLVQRLPLAETTQKVSAPPPLRATEDAPQARLTRAGTIKWTNTERTSRGLPALDENARLSAAAKAKLDDLFAKQYFAHESPTGVGPGEVVRAAGYQFIFTGENLALGNFSDDRALVTAWMNSPGHRENILSPQFIEIGVAVGRGTFEGKITWLAVQEFGLPLSTCPAPDPVLKDEIETREADLDLRRTDLESRRAELKTMERDDEYRQKVDEYNARVQEYNALLKAHKGFVDAYNVQIATYNECIQSYAGS